MAPASMKQRANQLAFGHSYGKAKSKSDAQITRATKRLAATRKGK